ncbi:hypothetical protein EDD18DRAFT_1110513 [Armillaria luteobubalina]|uniref:Uncharacterized protein n=1 Tax=Armillaria luteobubalina TaxID=153913 RepID=A0AA39PPI4_9AGAR|nr:hypothetical protein EDD18DRAFT_1110513 [Armillaria luteobubalina]
MFFTFYAILPSILPQVFGLPITFTTEEAPQTHREDTVVLTTEPKDADYFRIHSSEPCVTSGSGRLAESFITARKPPISFCVAGLHYIDTLGRESVGSRTKDILAQTASSEVFGNLADRDLHEGSGEDLTMGSAHGGGTVIVKTVGDGRNVATNNNGESSSTGNHIIAGDSGKTGKIIKPVGSMTSRDVIGGNGGNTTGGDANGGNITVGSSTNGDVIGGNGGNTTSGDVNGGNVNVGDFTSDSATSTSAIQTASASIMLAILWRWRKRRLRDDNVSNLKDESLQTGVRPNTRTIPSPFTPSRRCSDVPLPPDDVIPGWEPRIVPPSRSSYLWPREDSRSLENENLRTEVVGTTYGEWPPPSYVSSL